MQQTQLGQALVEWLADRAGGAVRISSMEPLAGGASRQSWKLDLTIRDGPQAGDYQLVLRRDLHSELQPNALTREQEFRLLQLVHAAGVAVPRPRWSGALPDSEGEARPFFLMDRVEGESIGSRVVRLRELEAARAVLPAQMGEQLAHIHAMSAHLDWLPGPAADQPSADWTIGRLRQMADQIGIVNPAYEFAFRWLEANQPQPAPACLVHGDYRIGNVIVDGRGLRAVIDWEFAHRGEPAEDLAWPGLRDWRFGNNSMRFGGIGTRQDFYAAYQRAGGTAVDLQAIAYWEIMGNLRWAVGCLSQAQRHRSGRDPSIELASLGRRAAEMELEFLRLIEAAETD